MKKTPMPVIAGALSLVSGIIGLISFMGLLIGGAAVGWTALRITGWIPGFDVTLSLLSLGTVVTLVTGVIAVVGGAFALRRRQWGWALAGSICAVIPSFFLGLVAVILIALSRKEFEQASRDTLPQTQTVSEA